LERALAQLPLELWREKRKRPPKILARADAAGATHAFAAALRERGIRFSLGYYVDERGRAGGAWAAEAALAAGLERRRQPPPRRLGRRTDRRCRSRRLAGGDAADRAPGAAAPRR